MARIRTIKPEFFTSEDICSLTVKARLAYVGLWCYADREGRLKEAPITLAAALMPAEMADFPAVLDELVDTGHVIRYTVEGKKYLFIPTFTEHQRPHNTERDSGIPPLEDGEITVKQPLNARESTTGKGKGKGKVSKQVLCKSATANKAKPQSKRFDDWYQHYPKKRNKQAAIRAWNSNNLDDKADTLIADTLNRVQNDPEWKRDKGQYIPNPASYLNGERWTDEIEVKTNSASTYDQTAYDCNGHMVIDRDGNYLHTDEEGRPVDLDIRGNPIGHRGH